MNILIAMDSFKGSMDAKTATYTIKDALHGVNENFTLTALPIADGGEGTLETLIDSSNGQRHRVPVHNPLMHPVEASYGIINTTTAVIEMAEASGLTLISETERSPLHTTTYGTGELIRHALDAGIRDFVIGIGGSATNDGGMGMLEALGYRFIDAQGSTLHPVGAALNDVAHIDGKSADPRLKDATFTVACDVSNPLYGPNGAAYVYGPQKGATKDMLHRLDEGLKHFHGLMAAHTGVQSATIPGGGAAGGLGSALYSFLNADLKSGISIVFDTLDIHTHIMNNDLIITGEGRIDAQTLMGKGPGEIAKLARRNNKPCLGIAAAITEDAYEANEAMTAMFSIANATHTQREMMHESIARTLLRRTVHALFSLHLNI